MRLRLDHFHADALGTILLVTDDDGALRALDFADYEQRMQRLLHIHYGTIAPVRGAAPSSLITALDSYFAGELHALDAIPVATRGTEFQRQVWQAVRRIPAGQTLSYGQLAARIGRPSASRAVGAANGANPIAIVVPCHRVVGADGSLTGYGGSLPRKRWLLAHEAMPKGMSRFETADGPDVAAQAR